jgi:hypothetical protein
MKRFFFEGDASDFKKKGGMLQVNGDMVQVKEVPL